MKMRDNSDQKIQEINEPELKKQTVHEKPKKWYMAKSRLIILVLLILAGLFSYGVYSWQHSKVIDLQTQLSSSQTETTSLKAQATSLQSQLATAQKPKHKKAKNTKNSTLTAPLTTPATQ